MIVRYGYRTTFMMQINSVVAQCMNVENIYISIYKNAG